YVDVGTSGGVSGLERGYCMMIGGEMEIVKHLDPISTKTGSRQRECISDARTRIDPHHGGTGIPSWRAEWSRALRQNGAQRNRIRGDGRVGRRPRSTAQRERWSETKPGRC